MINLKKILCPIDYSDCSKEALKYAVSYTIKNKAKLYLLHVIDTSAYDESLDTMVDEIIKQHKTRLLEYVPEETRNDMKIEALVVQEIPFAGIINVAKKNKIDMIVMGTHGRTGIAHILIGSVAEKVVRKAPCSVLTVRQSGHKFVMP